MYYAESHRRILWYITYELPIDQSAMLLMFLLLSERSLTASSGTLRTSIKLYTHVSMQQICGEWQLLPFHYRDRVVNLVYGS